MSVKEFIDCLKYTPGTLCSILTFVLTEHSKNMLTLGVKLPNLQRKSTTQVALLDMYGSLSWKALPLASVIEMSVSVTLMLL